MKILTMLGKFIIAIAIWVILHIVVYVVGAVIGLCVYGFVPQAHELGFLLARNSFILSIIPGLIGFLEKGYEGEQILLPYLGGGAITGIVVGAICAVVFLIMRLFGYELPTPTLLSSIIAGISFVVALMLLFFGIKDATR